MNCGSSDQLGPCFLDLNWDRPMDSAVCKPGDISPQSQYIAGALNSPPSLHLSMMDRHQHQQQQLGGGGMPLPGNLAPVPPHLAPFASDPGFVERAARFSCFGGGGGGGGGGGERNYGDLADQFGLEAGKLSGVNGAQMNLMGAQLDMGSVELGIGNACEDSSASDPVSAGGEGNGRKRKTAPKSKGKETPRDSPKMVEGDDFGAKRSRSGEEEVKPKTEQNGSSSSSGDDGKKQGRDSNANLPEPPKDYIHVRARRGQATDSHSLAERVRREKIGERMKLLQDLVPGCNKVTGKALMLDEIINYVQSLQRQVEFLSMKLASVNLRLDFNVESLLSKDIHQTNVALPNSIHPLETSSGAFTFAHQSQQGTPLHCVVSNGVETQCSISQLESSIQRALGIQLPSMEGFGDVASQLGAFWEDDLQNVVQMGFGQGQEMPFSSQGFHDPSPAPKLLN